jgi:hypothetical protein
VTEHKPRPPRLTEIVSSLDGRASFTIGELLDELGERAFGALMFIFAVPNIIPTPPGTSAVLGLPLVILTFQLMIGRQTMWLPNTIRKRTIDGSLVATFVRKSMPVLTRFEKVLRPRFSLVVVSDLAERVIGLVAFLLAIVLFLPIPLANIVPAAAIALLSLGLAERDGFAVIVGYLLGAGTVLVLVLVSSAIYAAVVTFINVLFGL